MESTEGNDFDYQLQAEQQYGSSIAAQQLTTGTTYTDPQDGTIYEWDAQKKGWFPKIDDNFLASYQASYGINTESTATETSEKEQTTTSEEAPPPATADPSLTPGTSTDQSSLEEPGQKKKKPNEKETPSWFEIDEQRNSNVYVSGLPTDITEEEFAKLMSKYGIVMETEEGTPKLKLYRDKDGHLKGDALCCYLKVESVKLAIQLLNDSMYRDHKIRVDKAQFQMKGTYDPSLKKKKKNIKKKGKQQQKMLDWRERKKDGLIRNKCERIVIFKRLFDPKEFEEDPTLITDIRSDLREECEKFGIVKKIMVFDRHPDGVVSMAFKDFEAADLCVTKMNNRWYAGKQLEVAHWDGLMDFQVEETDKEREERISNWEKFLEVGEVKVQEVKVEETF
ncbi:17S U2 SnRNP complex component HTATSF1-like [Halichondria panicea]|uniref:17S U2 SnRNP complex component HTATSF1-like n=1 Tax=Halichondria panicea TaxID=6063 RepID=UPI00312B7165